MKALLLAAGKGTRLRPYTDQHPKCLIPIHGIPLLKIWIDHFDRYGISDVLINTHHHANQVEAFVRAAQKETSVHLHTVHEPELRGSAGTLWQNRRFFEDQNEFIVAYADNLTNLNLEAMLDFHRNAAAKGAILTMGLIRAPNPKACGIVTLDKGNRIVKFVEKPDNPESDLANAGVYIATDKIFGLFDSSPADRDGVLDIGHHLLPKLAGRMYGFDILPSFLMDIGTPQAYEMALERWPNR